MARAYSERPVRSWLSVTKDDDNDLPGGPYRVLLANADGTLNFIDDKGVEHTGFPLQKGYNPIVVQRIKLGGTAVGIWAGL